MTEQQTAQWLLSRDSFLLLTHMRPDGDTLGSAAALARALRLCGKTAWVAYNAGVTDTYAGYMEGYYPPEDFVPAHIVAVDIATQDLFPRVFSAYLGSCVVCIDHPTATSLYAGETCLDAQAAACGEIIYRICGHLGVMDAEIARQLYIGISTDCGCFCYNNTTPETHRIAAQLMTYGDFWQQVNGRCFQTLSRKEIALQGRLMASAVFYDDGALMLCSVSLEDIRALHATQGDTEELSAYANKIEGVRVAATLRQLDARVWKLSLRTNGTLNATNVCALLGGGGHAAAAGATMYEVDEKEARKRVLTAIRIVQQQERNNA